MKYLALSILMCSCATTPKGGCTYVETREYPSGSTTIYTTHSEQSAPLLCLEWGKDQLLKGETGSERFPKISYFLQYTENRK